MMIDVNNIEPKHLSVFLIPNISQNLAYMSVFIWLLDLLFTDQNHRLMIMLYLYGNMNWSLIFVSFRVFNSIRLFRIKWVWDTFGFVYFEKLVTSLWTSYIDRVVFQQPSHLYDRAEHYWQGILFELNFRRTWIAGVVVWRWCIRITR